MAEPPKKSHPLEFPKNNDSAAEPEKIDASSAESEQPNVVQHVDERQIKQFITPLKTFEQQIGEHVMRALATEDTVAVITAVVVAGDGQQRVVSAALDPAMMQQVQQMLGEAAQQRDEEVPCLGFHCYIERKDEGKKKTTKKSKGAKKK